MPKARRGARPELVSAIPAIPKSKARPRDAARWPVGPSPPFVRCATPHAFGYAAQLRIASACEGHISGVVGQHASAC